MGSGYASSVKDMKVLVLGKGGSGKSALVNSLCKIDREGPEAAPESDSGCSATHCVRPYVTRRDGEDLVLYDTPGLDDQKRARQALDEVCDVTKGEVDVVLFCIALSRGLRIDDSYTELISVLAEAFGQSLWTQLIFVLTFAGDEDTSQREQKTKNVTEQLTRAVKAAGAEESEAESVTVLSAGYSVNQGAAEDWSEKIIEACRQRAISKCIFLPRKKISRFGWSSTIRRRGLAVVTLALGAYILWYLWNHRRSDLYYCDGQNH